VMGGEARIVALEVDGERGRESLAELEEAHGRLPRTLVSRAGEDGREYRLFVVPAHCEAGAIARAGKIGAGLEVFAEGDFVAVCPSVDRAGNVFAWSERVAVAELPGWVCAIVSGETEKREAAREELPKRAARGASARGEARAGGDGCEGDRLEEFLEDQCVVDLDRERWGEVWVTRSALREAYERWAEKKGVADLLGPKAFTTRLRGMGFNPDARRWVDGASVRAWEGARLRRPTEA